MKIGTRMALATSSLVALTLGGFGAVSLYARRAELENDLERQTQDLAVAVAAAVEAEAELGKQVGDPLDRAQELARHTGGATLTVLQLDDYMDKKMPADAAGRASKVTRSGRDVREFSQDLSDGHPFLAIAFPVRRQGEVVGVLELRKDASYIQQALFSAGLRMVGTLVGLVALLAGAVALIARSTVSKPLGRVLAEIGEVAKGDLTRTVFAERNDEVGLLAARFNAMTTSLREAREETRRSGETRRGLEERLRQSEKLATMGQLSAEIAHEVGTPLAVIGGRARAMERKANEPEEVARQAGIIAAQAARISKIIERLLRFARRGPTLGGRVDIGRVASEAVEFLEHQFTKADVTVDIARGNVDEIPGDPNTIQQVCLNLLVNAVQAMPKGGRLTVGTSLVTRRRGGLEAAPATRYACLEISDTGIGIPEEERAKIFEPFYSTKTDGSGLGLAVSQGIVKDHDGWMEVEARPEGGTTFRVFLPATHEQPGSLAPGGD